MTPAARIATAIEVLDAVLAGASAEKTLTTWARKSRYAGSGDRAGIRDLVFDALRCRRSYGWLGGGDTGRGLMIGALRSQNIDPAMVFTGEGYAPTLLVEAEGDASELATASLPVQLDIPDWLAGPIQASLGDDWVEILQMMQARAPVFLRVNRRTCTPDTAIAQLHAEGIEAAAHPLSDSALTVLTNPRKLKASKAFLEGMVEVQDVASQAVVDALTIPQGAQVLDYCAGGGGKALAIAARFDAQIFAHDINPGRMDDIPARAARAGVTIERLATESLPAKGPFDVVLCDAPCSGSGAWRRSPEAKWRLTRDRLDELCALQSDILDKASRLVASNGTLVYVTCSLFEEENRLQVEAFLTRNTEFGMIGDLVLTPLDGGDGFYLAQMRRLTARP